MDAPSSAEPIAPLAVDLFCGRGGWTKALLKAGFRVVGVDLFVQPDYPSEASFVCADVRSLEQWRLPRERPFVVVASPPCEPFTTLRSNNHEPPVPEGFENVAHAFRIIAGLRPTHWAIENVRGALKWWKPLFGEPDVRTQPYYVWGNLPEDFRPTGPYPSKLRYRDPGRRAEIPAQLADPLASSLMAAWRATVRSTPRPAAQSTAVELAGLSELPAAAQSIAAHVPALTPCPACDAFACRCQSA